MVSNSYAADERIKTASWLRGLAKDMTEGDPVAAGKLVTAARMVERGNYGPQMSPQSTGCTIAAGKSAMVLAERQDADLPAVSLADDIEKNGLCNDPLWPKETRDLIVKALRHYGPNVEQILAAKRWAALMLMDPMDIVTVAMGAPSINEFMEKMEERADAMLKRLSATVGEGGKP